MLGLYQLIWIFLLISSYVSQCLTQDIATIKTSQHFEDVSKTKIHH